MVSSNTNMNTNNTIVIVLLAIKTLVTIICWYFSFVQLF